MTKHVHVTMIKHELKLGIYMEI